MIKINAPTLLYYFLRVGAIMKIEIYGQDRQFERVLKNARYFKIYIQEAKTF